MRRYKKNNILELLETIHEAHKEYEHYKENNNTESCNGVLALCQESAISIGNAIENSEGEGTESVRLLERYCEDLYQLSQGQEKVNIDRDLSDIRECINNELHVTLEVAFFPYKASMWDSMESIYLAFRSSANVNVYLVPIPYYNRNHDGTIESFRCESDLFPEDEPVTDWQCFDIKKIKPDIAFIHNPYDDQNFVTTVDPRFYSFELKKNVDCLVYCPYYSTVGSISKALSLCKGYLYSDYILTQSKYQIGFYDDLIPRKKFLPMGSPKFDKVIRLNSEKINNPEKFYARVPQEWRNKKKSRNVCFFNTSLSGLLSDTPVFLDKMEYVFKIFEKEKRALLLWRPHPLTDETLKALRPDFYERYLRIQQEFLEKDIGIIDRTPDISVSVTFCDCFIGDGGTSVTSLFLVSEKPMFIFDDTIMDIPSDQDIVDTLFQIPFTVNQNGYIVTVGNKVYKCDFPLRNPIRFRYIDRLTDFRTPLYDLCCNYGDDVFIAPLRTENVIVLHKDGKKSYIRLLHCTDQPDKFFADVFYKKYIVLIPNEYPYFVRLNMETGQVTYSEDLRETYVCEDANGNRTYGGWCVFNSSLVIGSRENNNLLILDIETMHYKVVAVGENTSDGTAGFAHVSAIKKVPFSDSASLIILPYRGTKLRRYYPLTGEVREYNADCEGFYCSGQDKEDFHDNLIPFSSALIKNKTLILAPYRGNMFIALDMVTGESHKWKFPLPLEWQPHNRYYTGGYKGKFVEYNDKIYWVSATQRRLYEIELTEDDCKIIRKIDVEFDTNEVRDHANGFCENAPWWTEYSMHEDAVNSLSSFISGKTFGAPFDKRKELDSISRVAVNLDGTCGEKVCKFFKDKMKLK